MPRVPNACFFQRPNCEWKTLNGHWSEAELSAIGDVETVDWWTSIREIGSRRGEGSDFTYGIQTLAWYEWQLPCCRERIVSRCVHNVQLEHFSLDLVDLTMEVLDRWNVSECTVYCLFSSSTVLSTRPETNNRVRYINRFFTSHRVLCLEIFLRSTSFPFSQHQRRQDDRPGIWECLCCQSVTDTSISPLRTFPEIPDIPSILDLFETRIATFSVRIS